MPLTQQCKADHPDAYKNENKIHVRDSYVGLVVDKYVHRWIDDIDYHAVVFDPEIGEFRDIEYATTRAATYENRAVVDAAPDLMIRYAYYQDQQQRIKRAKGWRKLFEEAQECRVTCDQLRMLRHAIGLHECPAYDPSSGDLDFVNTKQIQYRECLVPLKTKKFRSEFRESLTAQLRAWLEKDSVLYQTPFSRKQWHSLTRYATYS